MEKKERPTESIEEGLLQLAETQFAAQVQQAENQSAVQLQQQTGDFTRGFIIHQHRPPEARAASRLPVENPADLLDQEIIDLHFRVIELGVLDETIENPAHRRLLPFIALDPTTKRMLVKVIPLSRSAYAREELAKSIALMRDIEGFLRDSTVSQDAYLHIRELVKALFANIYAQLHHGRAAKNSLRIDNAKVLQILEILEFAPAESLRNITYEDTYDKFKTLMTRKGYQYDVGKNGFRKWINTANNDPVYERIRQYFELDLEYVLQSETDRFKTDLLAQFQQS